MGKKLNFFFDQDADILYLSLGQPRLALSKEVGGDVILRLDPKTKNVVGFTILNLSKRFKKMKHPEDLPVSAKLSYARP